MLPNRTQRLTVRELAVLELLARGFSHQEITTTLCFSWRAVAKYTNNLYQKLRVTGRRDTVERAAALGIVPSALSTMGMPSPISRVDPHNGGGTWPLA